MTQTNVTIHSADRLGRCLHDRAEVDVRTWRLCFLLDAGFDEELAQRLAARPDVELHALLELVDRGCPPALAGRILAPLADPAAER